MPVLLTGQKVSKSFDERALFDSIDFVIQSEEKIGLIGPNGAGKSTLLKILMDQEPADSGEIIKSRGLRLSYLGQQPKFKEGSSVQSSLAENLHSLDEWELNQRISEQLWKHNFERAGIRQDTKVETLSGGWKKRIAILREVISEPDLLLLDEPTNHLDIEGIFWLEELLQNAKMAFLTITHDRYFLDQVTNRILELDRRNEHGLLSVNGNYSKYLETKTAILEAQKSREASLRSVLRRETEWLKAGVKARTTKQQARIQRAHELKSTVSELSARNQKQELKMGFHTTEDKPKRLLEAKRISKAYDTTLFEELDLLLTPGKAIGILGENGSGKSSLIRVLLGEERPDSGHIFHSDLLQIAYFEQGKDQLDLDQSLLRSVCPYGDSVYYRGRQIHVRTYLQKFLFDQEKMELNIGSLSGGEQSRVVLARLMLKEANLLILDEPTNDLDIETLNVLEDCITEFEGAVLLVSHDRFFLDRVCTELLAFPPKQIELKPRQLQSFHSFEQWKGWYQSFEASESKPQCPKKQKKASGSALKQQQKIMKKIEKREAELEKLQNECASEEVISNYELLTEIGQQVSHLQEEIGQLYKEWESLES